MRVLAGTRPTTVQGNTLVAHLLLVPEGKSQPIVVFSRAGSCTRSITFVLLPINSHTHTHFVCGRTSAQKPVVGCHGVHDVPYWQYHIPLVPSSTEHYTSVVRNSDIYGAWIKFSAASQKGRYIVALPPPPQKPLCQGLASLFFPLRVHQPSSASSPYYLS